MASSAETENQIGTPVRAIVAAYGFVPALFQAQSELPAGIEAECDLINAILLQGPALARAEKDAILSAVAAARQNSYVFGLHQTEGAPARSSLLLDFAVKLALFGPCLSNVDIDLLCQEGLTGPAILETIATVALGNMLCTLAEALNPAPETTTVVHMPLPPTAAPGWNVASGPYLHSDGSFSKDLPQFGTLRDQFGFVPKLFQLQSPWPELLGAECRALELVVWREDHLSRIQKELAFLVTSTANLNTYGVALHSQVLSILGVSLEDCEAIICDLDHPSLKNEDKALLAQISRIAGRQQADARFDAKILADQGFTPAQIVEAVVTASLGAFLNTLQFGLGAPPDFLTRTIFTEKDLYPPGLLSRPTSDAVFRLDPDSELVERVQAGETEVFEELVRRHTRRVFGTLNGILGNYDEARDATQDVFVKAFEKINGFEGRAKFSTWLTSIAVNTGVEVLRQRKATVPLDDASDEDFRPRRVQAWAEDPESLFAASQVNALVRDAVLRLPQKYRVAVLLRDINQLSTEDAAEALGLSVPALKARLLRGRLMLREALAPHFVRPERMDV
jgi:RNA polymerase sigma-70 factor (ECF subfamily)